MARRKGLGRGLDALIPVPDADLQQPQQEIAIQKISPNPRQPRASFNDEEMSELAESITAHGIIQPLIVTYNSMSGSYTLIAGERRLIAAKLANLTHVPVIIREATEQQRLELALIENVQRSDLNPLEAAEAYRQMVDDFNLSHEEIAKRVGKSRVTITNSIRLLQLSKKVQEAITNDQISEGHARAMLALQHQQAQDAALDTIIRKELNVRQTEEYVRKLSGQTAERKTSLPTIAPEVSDLEAKLRTRLGTKINIHRRKNGGSVVIHYYSEEELHHIIETLLGDAS
jgi:ParB family chromosome partitioning protein